MGQGDCVDDRLLKKDCGTWLVNDLPDAYRIRAAFDLCPLLGEAV